MQKLILKRHDYIIKVDGKEVWRGPNPKEKYWEIKEQNLDKEVGISWHSDEDLLVC